MFNGYSQKGCIFECRLKNTYNYVKCIPWDYPIPPSLINSEHVEMCDSSYNYSYSSSETPADSKLATFENFMDSEESIEDCNCLPDCDQQVFETQVSYSQDCTNLWDGYGGLKQKILYLCRLIPCLLILKIYVTE